MTHLEFDLNVDIFKNIAEMNSEYEVETFYDEELKRGSIRLIHKKFISEHILEKLKETSFKLNGVSLKNNKINATYFLE